MANNFTLRTDDTLSVSVNNQIPQQQGPTESGGRNAFVLLSNDVWYHITVREIHGNWLWTEILHEMLFGDTKPLKESKDPPNPFGQPRYFWLNAASVRALHWV